MAQCIDQASSVARRSAGAAWIHRLRETLVRASDELARYARRLRERRALERLDDAMLRDIGISRADVELEVSKRFWQA